MEVGDSKAYRFQETGGVIVEVSLWEVFLLYNRHNLCRTLAAYSLDNGPVENETDDLTMVTFRFTAFDWANTLSKMLEEHNIPVVRVVNRLGNYTPADVVT